MLTAFFSLGGARLCGRRAQRHADAERALRRCCELHLEKFLTETERFLLAAERQVEPQDAATRLVDPGLLLAVLPSFVRDPEWFGDDLEDRRVRLLLVERLLDFLLSFPPMEDQYSSCDAVETTVALWAARSDLDRRRAERRSSTGGKTARPQ
jgi:hypothetical protein